MDEHSVLSATVADLSPSNWPMCYYLGTLQNWLEKSFILFAWSPLPGWSPQSFVCSVYILHVYLCFIHKKSKTSCPPLPHPPTTLHPINESFSPPLGSDITLLEMQSKPCSRAIVHVSFIGCFFPKAEIPQRRCFQRWDHSVGQRAGEEGGIKCYLEHRMYRWKAPHGGHSNDLSHQVSP